MALAERQEIQAALQREIGQREDGENKLQLNLEAERKQREEALGKAAQKEAG